MPELDQTINQQPKLRISSRTDYQFSFAPYLSLLFKHLPERNFITPTAISTLIMYAILPASTLDTSEVQNELANFDYYNVNRFQVGGLDTVTYIYPNNNQYAVHFEMNDVDSVHTRCVYGQSQKDLFDNETVHPHLKSLIGLFKHDIANENVVFWNYPGVGESEGVAHSIYDLIDAGYLQVMRLINQRVPAAQITLVGRSLGGGIAIHVARRLHQEGYPVNLTIDRTFSQIAQVLSSSLEENYLINHPKTAPLLTSLITSSLIGIAIGTTLAGLMATVGLSFSIAVASVGYLIAETIQYIGNIFATLISILGLILACPFFIISEELSGQIKEFLFTIAYRVDLAFAALGYYINYSAEGIASITHSIFNGFSTVCGSIIALAGGLISGVLGVIVGSIASLQLLVTDKPYFFPTTFAFSAILVSTCCELNSVNQMQRLMTTSKQNQSKPMINVYNTLDDAIIKPSAALATGLGVPLTYDPKPNITTPIQSGSVNCFWYQKGGHTDPLSENDLLISATLN